MKEEDYQNARMAIKRNVKHHLILLCVCGYKQLIHSGYHIFTLHGGSFTAHYAIPSWFDYWIDIVGFFSQKGQLEKGDLGLIEVKDFISFAAVKFGKVKDLLNNIRDQKMKGKKYKIEVARKVIKKEEE